MRKMAPKFRLSGHRADALAIPWTAEDFTNANMMRKAVVRKMAPFTAWYDLLLTSTAPKMLRSAMRRRFQRAAVNVPSAGNASPRLCLMNRFFDKVVAYPTGAEEGTDVSDGAMQ
jgi:hypothetical protein